MSGQTQGIHETKLPVNPFDSFFVILLLLYASSTSSCSPLRTRFDRKADVLPPPPHPESELIKITLFRLINPLQFTGLHIFASCDLKYVIPLIFDF